MESERPRNGARAGPKWSQGGPKMESGGLISSSRFSSFYPHPLIWERGKMYHLNERKKLLHTCQHVELVNYPFNWSSGGGTWSSVWQRGQPCMCSRGGGGGGGWGWGRKRSCRESWRVGKVWESWGRLHRGRCHWPGSACGRVLTRCIVSMGCTRGTCGGGVQCQQVGEGGSLAVPSQGHRLGVTTKVTDVLLDPA